MKPYGERPTGNACTCCNMLRGGDDGHKRTAERMQADIEASRELADHNEQKSLEAWRERCEGAHIVELGHLIFTSHGERHEIAEEIAIRRLRELTGGFDL